VKFGGVTGVSSFFMENNFGYFGAFFKQRFLRMVKGVPEPVRSTSNGI
jgi:hypothetical protein